MINKMEQRELKIVTTCGGSPFHLFAFLYMQSGTDVLAAFIPDWR